MPVTSGQITFAKTMIVDSRGYSVFTVLVFPFCLGYGIKAGALATLMILLAMSVFENINYTAQSDINFLLTQMGGAAAHVAFVIPVIPFAGKLFAGGSLIWALAMFAVLAAAGILFFLAAKYAYLPGALGMQNTSYSNKQMTDSVLLKSSRRKSTVHSYTLKELKTVIRTPNVIKLR